MSQLPTLGHETKEAPAVTVKVKKPKSLTVTIEIPTLEEVFEGYFSNRVDIQSLTMDQQHTLKAILFGLQSRFAKLRNGKDVSNAGDAIKWMIESVSGKTDLPK